MIRLKDLSISIMVMYAIALHFCWSGIILIDHSAVDATAVHALYRYIPQPEVLSGVIFLAGLLAVFGLFTRIPWIVLLLLPQQILLMMSAAGTVEAIWLAQFADGVLRSRAFIAADQVYSILAAIGHTVAIIVHAVRLSE